MFGGRWDAVPETVAEDIRSVDHRPLGGPPAIGVEAFLAAMRGVLAVGARGLVITTVETRGDRLAVVRCHYLVGDGAVLGDLEVLQLIEIDDAGRFVTNDIYDLDQIDAARADLDRRARSAARPDLSNMATRAGLAVYEHGSHGRWEEAAALCRPDVIYADHRPLVGGVGGTDLSAYLAAGQSIFDAGVTELSYETQCVRGERLALGRVVYRGSAAEVAAIGLMETDDTGLVVAAEAYDLDQLAEAQAEIEARYAAELGDERGAVWLAVVRLLEGIAALDWPAMRSALTDDFAGVDHRPLGWGTFDAGSFVGLYRDRGGAVLRLGARRTRGAGGHPAWLLCAGRGPRDICRRRRVPDGRHHQLRGARRPRRSSRGVPVRSARTRPRVPPWLRTVRGRAGERCERRANKASTAAVLRGDWEAFESMTSDDVVGFDHRALVGSEIIGLEAMVAVSRGLVEIGVTSIALSPIAIEGDRWALQRASFQGADGEWSVDVLSLLGLDTHGLVHWGEIFDLDQLDLARARLTELSGSGTASTDLGLENDRRHERRGRSGMPSWRTIGWGWRSGCILTRSAADRRPLLREWQEYLGREASTDWMMSIAEIGVKSIEPSIVAARGEHLVVLDVVYAGARAATRLVQLVELDASGLMRRSELFDSEQLQDAIMRLEELYTATLPAGQAATWEAVCTVTQAYGDQETLLAALADDIVLVDHRPAGFGTLEWSDWADIDAFDGTFAEQTESSWMLHRIVLGLSDTTAFTRSDLLDTEGGGAFVDRCSSSARSATA